MTCIVAYTNGTTCYMGGDRFLGTSWSNGRMAEPKVWRNRNILFGGAGSKRMIDIIRYKFTPPNVDAHGMSYLVGDFLDRLRELFEEEGFLYKENNVEQPELNLIIGFEGKLYEMYCDMQISEFMEPYVAIGSGAKVALGAMYTAKWNQPKKDLQRALEAADAHVPTVCGPFDTIQLRNGNG